MSDPQGSGGSAVVDRATRRALSELVRWSGDPSVVARVTALEPGGRTDVPVADFFAGDLRTPEGEAVSLAAYRRAGEAAFEAADALLATSPFLADLNVELGRGTFRLFLARRVWMPIWEGLVRVLSAEAIAGDGTEWVFVHGHPAVPRGVLERAAGGEPRVSYTSDAFSGRWNATRQLLAVLRGRVRRRPGGTDPGRAAAGREGSSVLMTYEGELGPDRSRRFHPHWLDPEEPLPFATYVFPTNEPVGGKQVRALEEFGVRAVEDGWLGGMRAEADRSPLGRWLARWRRRAWRRAFVASDAAEAHAVAAAARLLEEAAWILAAVRGARVGCMISGDPHLIQADAMAVVAERTGVPLVSYQYSNLAWPTPAMASTADLFLLMHESFRPIWDVAGAAPRRFEVVGYPFDDAFARVRDRARACRLRLEEAGARFVLCYFDESVQDHRFGVFGEEAHRREVLGLVRAVLSDTRLGLIVKSQFVFNSPSRLWAGDDVIGRAVASGRYIELCEGSHRNRILPAEAAMAADLTIGNLVGATAALEAALAGCRAVLLDQHGQIRLRRELYESAELLYPSVDAVLAAVDEELEKGAASRPLGDWSPILHHFDAYRDGRAMARMREILNRIVTESAA